MLFKELIAVYIEKRKKPINTKCIVTRTDYYSKWDIHLPLGFKWLRKQKGSKNEGRMMERELERGRDEIRQIQDKERFPWFLTWFPVLMLI
jgi:hypothetical protein